MVENRSHSPEPKSEHKYPQAIDAASGEKRTALEVECLDLLESPEFDGSKFNRFAEIMIGLLGGTQESKTFSSSNTLVNRKEGYLAIYRCTETPWNFSWLDIERPADNYRQCIVETMSYGKDYDLVDAKTGEPLPNVRYHLEFDKPSVDKRQTPSIIGEFDSVVTGERTRQILREEEPTTTSILTKGRVQEVCRKVFDSYQHPTEVQLK